MAKILFLATEDWFFWSHRFFLAIEAKKCGHTVLIACRFSKYRKLFEKYGMVTFELGLQRKSLSPFCLISEIVQITLLYFQQRPDILYHLAVRPIVVGGFAALLARKPCIVSSFAGMGHLFAFEGKPSLKLCILRRLIKISAGKSQCLVENKDDKYSLEKCGIAKTQINVLPGSGVNISAFSPSSTIKKKKSYPVVLMASRLIWPKGVGVFVEAAKIVQSWGLIAEFVLVGEPDQGNPESVPLAQIRDWINDGVVNWQGPKTDMNSVFNDTDVFCLPTSYREGMPKVLLEAMACGVPCITTNTRGCKEAVRHEENGLLVPPNDPKALAFAIRKLADSPKLRKKLGEAGRKIAENEYNEKSVCTRTMELFKGMLKTSNNNKRFIRKDVLKLT